MTPEEGSTVVVVWNVVVHVVDVVDLVFLEIAASESESDGSPLVICNCMIFISPSFWMQVTPATSAMPQDLRAV